jgi:hypothetical protein
MKVDSPRGWELVNENSFTFCSYPEPFVAFLMLERNPALHVNQKIDWLREVKESYEEGVHKKNPAAHEIVDRYLETHSVHKLPNFGAPDQLANLVLYWEKPVDKA